MNIEKNYEIAQGSDFELLFTFKDGAGALIDLTGYTFAGKLRRKTQDSTVIASFAFTILDQSQPATKGQVRAKISAATSSAIALDPSENYKRKITYFAYDMERTRPDGNILRFREGSISISPEVTR